MKNILFDLDGTLLPMDLDEFTHGYFRLLAAKLAPLGYPDAKALVAGVWAGTAAMVKNDGSRPNAEAFWDTFASIFPQYVPEHRRITDDFYAHEFAAAKAFTGANPLAKPLVDLLRGLGYTVALATNPVFPEIGVGTRLGWIGLSPEDFAVVTTYENMSVSKPNPAYFTAVARMLGADPADCLMVGNNVEEDADAARAAGMDVLLVTDCLINEKNADLSAYRTASFAQLPEILKTV